VRVLILGGDRYRGGPTTLHDSPHTKLLDLRLPPFPLDDSLPCDLLDRARANLGRLDPPALEPRAMWRKPLSHIAGTQWQGRERDRTDRPR
jgi:hypothetical protein